MHPENAIDNGDFIKILVYKFILNFIHIYIVSVVFMCYNRYEVMFT